MGFVPGLIVLGLYLFVALQLTLYRQLLRASTGVNQYREMVRVSRPHYEILDCDDLLSVVVNLQMHPRNPEDLEQTTID